MTHISFIRHGETAWNTAGRLQGRTDIALNSTGLQQAKACGEYLEAKDWDIIITSPLKRARKTAEIIQSKLEIPLIEMEEFIEVGFGEAEGLTFAERDKLYPNRDYPKKEHADMVTKRFLKGLNKVKQQYKDQHILIVSHGAFINAIAYHYSNGRIGTGVSRLNNGGITSLYLDDTHGKITAYNQIDHLNSLILNNDNKI
ncbi:histidine phosphatase family protein [Staphylococcus sp. ACRSN]|uniref:histidine phosphatase family protein n=1 Tax=Staphylococcus sp. ACRSN TaxID=2918214 RepID=UPI001EF357D8|nr:histidine phosphatase family protein [Staphylococcus sp. ACRSN]MCG7337966.1 histidine phosphatase family protein [Staphylococcus sp. ACRSN]